ncbi:AAA family ATPase [Okeania sp. SIO2B3]|uniref:AAA family ATPase n=1 Tax=Okeania sp. SIO2B3 TaxID=2607784 RepID=UPI0025D5EF23|nr:AAA family ATPase [Okeania sp. SIO2B3]
MKAANYTFDNCEKFKQSKLNIIKGNLSEKMPKQSIPRIEYLRVQNYRALRDLELKKITPLTVFLGPNGSGKSTIFDVFAFLAECFTDGLRKAWEKRGRFRELRTRDTEGNIVFELKYRETKKSPLITYHLAIAERIKGPYVAEEWLQWRRAERGKPFKFLDFKEGEGEVTTGEKPDKDDNRIKEKLESAEFLAVSTLGQFAKHPRVSALRKFITGWHLSYLTADNTRSIPEAGAQERLSPTGDNLPNVIQYLKEQHPERLEKILDILSCRVPRLEKVAASIMQDGRLLLQIKDAPFATPILAKFASDGTLKMLAYLTVLHDPDPAQLIGIEEPENHLHPRLLPELAEECRAASANTQLMVTTHSPFFVDGLKPQELWVLYRDKNGYTQAKRTDEMPGIKEFVEEGASLGDLWMEDFFEVGNPLKNQGAPRKNQPRNQ